jgi:hypothetical protein
MDISSVLKFFVPKERKFYGMFNNVADTVVEASSEFIKLINAPTFEERKSVGNDIKSIEKKCDDLTNNIFEELHKTFITPFDREDITTLTASLDDIVDLIYSAAGKFEYYHCDKVSPFMKDMIDQIYQGTLQIQIAVAGLEKMNKNPKVMNACKQINKIESRVDILYHEGLSDLFETEKNPIELIKQKEILQNLEKIANKIEDISDIVKTINIKYA